jgi:arsenical pump membrane protein
MIDASSSQIATWSIAAAAVFGVIIRPRNLPEALWAVLGAAALVLFSLLPVPVAVAAVAKGTDVYLFLVGMMVLAELARHEGLFDWLAAYAVNHAAGSTTRLFILVYAVGTVVTIFLSNDATAVVLTPAVYAAARRAGAPPLPYLLVCAFIANAASFVLPISNPANLVVFGSQMPVLRSWIAEFGIASVVSIVTTYAILYLTQRKLLSGRIATRVSQPSLTGSARIVAGAIWVTAIALLIASTLGWQLGFPTFLAGVGAWIGVSVIKREAPWRVLGKVSWSVLPLVAGLFVLVAGVEQTGVLKSLTELLSSSARQSPHETALLAGTAVAFACNAINNLPMGLLASTVAQSAQLPAQVTGAVLIGVDLGPNLSVTGSLATILWLVAIRREGEDVSAWKFLAVGSLVMPLPLLASLASFIGLAVINRF